MACDKEEADSFSFITELNPVWRCLMPSGTLKHLDAVSNALLYVEYLALSPLVPSCGGVDATVAL